MADPFEGRLPGTLPGVQLFAEWLEGLDGLVHHFRQGVLVVRLSLSQKLKVNGAIVFTQLIEGLVSLPPHGRLW